MGLFWNPNIVIMTSSLQSLAVVNKFTLIKASRSVLRTRMFLSRHGLRNCILYQQTAKSYCRITGDGVVKENPTHAVEKQYHDRNFITGVRAMQEFIIRPEHLEGLRATYRRSASDAQTSMKVYWRKDVEAISLRVWGSHEALQAERDRREEQLRQFAAFYERWMKGNNKLKYRRSDWPVRGLRQKNQELGLKSPSGRIILAALSINAANFALKLAAWIMTGSHALFSEAIHSAADTFNQVILAYGIKSSAKKADRIHPYGYTNMQYVSSLISGVGIFCIGAGVSVYHGIDGLVNPHSLQSTTFALAVLGVSFASESITLCLAVRSILESARAADMTFAKYVMKGHDPCVNVILLEDAAAVLGVVIATASMGLSVRINSSIPDALGSVAIGGLLGAVATFMIISNSMALVGRSMPEETLRAINEELEGDIMVRQVHDVKGIDMGNGILRYKAEVDVDGRELARFYLSRKNMNDIMAQVRSINTEKELEAFVLEHGENIVDCLGEQVDRIEKELKQHHPQVRHVDLEVL